VAVVEVTVAPVEIAGHGDIGLKIVRGYVALVPAMIDHVRDIKFYWFIPGGANIADVTRFPKV
jgi:hypothetical protein